MAIKTSYSQNSTYIQCPKHWHLLYKEGWEGIEEGPSVYFGSAIDVAINALLNGKENWKQLFHDNWTQYHNFGNPITIFDNENITYSYKDFDEYILTEEDYRIIGNWAKQLKLLEKTSTTAKDCVTLYKAIVEKKKNPYNKPTKNEIVFFNRISWLSLKKKGELLLNAFYTQFYPKIKKVIATQQKAQIKDPNTGDTITGFIDMVLEIEGYNEPIIFDLKTASQPYTQQDIDLTQQLTLYSAMKSNEYNTNLVGYVVLCKNIKKDIIYTCENCNTIKNSKHKTCNAQITDGSRCNGKWVKKIIANPEIQVLIEKKNLNQINDLLTDYSNIILAMKQEIVYKNTNKCTDWFGGICPFYNACHKGDFSNLKKK